MGEPCERLIVVYVAMILLEREVMCRKRHGLFFCVWAFLLLVAVFGVVLNVLVVRASGTIYIRADGSIEGTDKIISADNVTYTFIGNINDSIVIERNNIVVDGSGFTVQGTGALWSKGIDLSHRSNVAVQNTTIKSFYHGIYLYASSKVTLSQNSIANNWHGIWLNSSSNNSISRNHIANNSDGIWLILSSNNNIIENHIANKYEGIGLSESSNNSISGNSFVNNGLVIEDSYGNVVSDNLVNSKPLVYLEGASGIVVEEAGQVVLVRCSHIRVKNLNLSSATIGVQLWQTNRTEIFGNNVTANNDGGIMISRSSNNRVLENDIANNWCGISLKFSLNNSISGNNIANNLFGIQLSESSNNSIGGNNIANNSVGIWLSRSLNNSISGNNIVNNSDAGIWLEMEPVYNKVYHNNFVNNTRQVNNFRWSQVKFWDDGYPSGGNYWSDYNGTDSDYDGIGDTPYFIDAKTQDNYPLMGMFSSFNTSYGYAVDFVSNSSISHVSFNLSSIEVYPPEAILTFNVSGETDTKGFLRICIPKILINSSYVIRFDGEIVTNTTWPQVRELLCSKRNIRVLLHQLHSQQTHHKNHWNNNHSRVSIIPYPTIIHGGNITGSNSLQKKTCTKKA